MEEPFRLPSKSAALDHPGAATSRDASLAAARTIDLSRLLLLEAAEAAAAGHAGDALSRAQRRQYLGLCKSVGVWVLGCEEWGGGNGMLMKRRRKRAGHGRSM